MVIAIEKNNAMLMVCAMLFNVALIPLPTPLMLLGREFIIAVVFGEANNPLPIPFSKSIPSKVHTLKLYGNKVSKNRDIAMITIPVVANNLAPYLSVNMPPIGPNAIKPTIMGSIYTPAQNGVCT